MVIDLKEWMFFLNLHLKNVTNGSANKTVPLEATPESSLNLSLTVSCFGLATAFIRSIGVFEKVEVSERCVRTVRKKGLARVHDEYTVTRFFTLSCWITSCSKRAARVDGTPWAVYGMYDNRTPAAATSSSLR